MSIFRYFGIKTLLSLQLSRPGGSTDFGDSKIVWDPRRSPVLGTRSSEPMHSIRANLFWATLLFPVAGFGWKPFKGRAWNVKRRRMLRIKPSSYETIRQIPNNLQRKSSSTTSHYLNLRDSHISEQPGREVLHAPSECPKRYNGFQMLPCYSCLCMLR